MPSSSSSPGQGGAAFVTVAVACTLIAGFTAPVAAQGGAAAGGASVVMLQEDGGEFSCDGMTKQEVSERLNEYAVEEINTKIQQNSERIPDSARSAMVGERINIEVGSASFATVVNDNARIERIETERLEDPTLRVTTDCETIERIYNSENRQAQLQAAINDGDIEFEGLTATSDVETSYGSKAVQTYTIVESGETGNAQDAANGFSSGLTMN